MSTRSGLTASVLTELDAAAVRPVLFIEAQFTGGTLYLWTGMGSISWNEQTWTGAGTLLEVSPVDESTDIQASGVSITLSGVTSSIVSLALSQCRINMLGKIYLGFLNSTGAVIADPYLVFSGKLDQPSFIMEGDTCIISISYESLLVDLQRSRERRYTDQDQRIDYPTDKGFQYVAVMQETEVVWGGKSHNARIQDPTPAPPTPKPAPKPNAIGRGQ